MATLKDILRKIGAVKKTQQITRAMNMVAASKLRSSQVKMVGFKPYAEKFSEVLGNLSSRIDPGIHPLLVKKEDISRVELLHFTSDRGLCGSFNMNNIHFAEKWIAEQKAKDIDCGLTLVGKKGSDYFRKRNFDITKSYTHIYGSVDISFINQMTAEFIRRYMSNDIQEVYMLYARFVNMAKQEPVIVKLLPVEPPQKGGAGEDTSTEYLYEPSAEELLIELLPKHISVQIYNAFLQNEVSEHASRMASMDNATKNCKEMVEDLTTMYNKARQAAITAELMDIVGGAEALS
jgi:F-type H+-transporting ATPase subunit gamma